MKSYSQLKINEDAKLKITILCEELISEFQKVIKNKDFEI